MDTNKAAYWIAVGVFALALNSEYQHGRFVALHQAAEHAGLALCRMATRAEQTVAVARVFTSREGSRMDDLPAATAVAKMALSQLELLRAQAWDEAELLRDRIREEVQAQADVIRAQAEVQRAEIDQARIRMRSQFRLARTVDRRVVVVCPKTGVRIAVNAGMRPAEVSPEVEDSF